MLMMMMMMMLMLRMMLMRHLVTVDTADKLVDQQQQLLFRLAVLLSPGVVQVVGVDDADDMLELVRPSLPVVVPAQMLWLL